MRPGSADPPHLRTDAIERWSRVERQQHVPVMLDRVVALLAPALDHDRAVMVESA